MFLLNLAPICSEVDSNFITIEIARSGCRRRAATLVTAEPSVYGMDATLIRRIIGRTGHVRNLI
ncbi:hypothetical protein PSCICL_11960 [Pseudomonas cichorii]|nr:hypothetical protein ALQ47_00534 [Pseudomonas cichorii]GFM61335.1 hypothetical protein PSCICG_24950 [Pseudomonas cichorii]GFM70204.1 hypothetical protein PSCICL_11960 [Pseudomonas cichorii]